MSLRRHGDSQAQSTAPSRHAGAAQRWRAGPARPREEPEIRGYAAAVLGGSSSVAEEARSAISRARAVVSMRVSISAASDLTAPTHTTPSPDVHICLKAGEVHLQTRRLQLLRKGIRSELPIRPAAYVRHSRSQVLGPLRTYASRVRHVCHPSTLISQSVVRLCRRYAVTPASRQAPGAAARPAAQPSPERSDRGR